MPISLDGTGSISGISTFSFSDEIIHTGDTNTAIKFPANDTISFETSGNERLRITSGGNLMLGTSTAAITSGIGMMIANSSGARIKLCDSDLGVDGASGYEMIASSNGTAYLLSLIHISEPTRRM